MNRLGEILIGIDVGTTSMKASAFDPDGTVLGSASAPTAWHVGEHGEAQVDMDALADEAIQVLAACVPESHAGANVAGIGITGMAETGVLVDARNRPVMPAIAWYDERGKEDLASLPASFRDEFSAVTGLACKAECSFSKLLWRRARGDAMPSGATWLNALEYIAYRLTGIKATEPSLASRTGLLDQSSVAPWPATLDLIGADATLLPAFAAAGTPVGIVAESAPRALRGAAVTVAGHDHLVGSVGAGAIGGDDLYDSCGTADVILRTVPRTLTNDERATLVHRGLSAGRHVLPGSTAILGATRSGLVLGRILSMLGAHDRDSRRSVADAWDADAPKVTTVEVSEPPAWANEVTVSLREDARPAEVWSAAMRYVLDATSLLVHAVDDIAGPYATATAAGGWARLDGVFRGKASIMPGLRRSEALEPGARGAAVFAAHAAGLRDGALAATLDPRPTDTAPQKEPIT